MSIMCALCSSSSTTCCLLRIVSVELCMGFLMGLLLTCLLQNEDVRSFKHQINSYKLYIIVTVLGKRANLLAGA